MNIKRAVIGAILVTALAAIYVIAIAGRGIALIRTGEVAGIGIGVGVMLIPLIVVWLIFREWRLASTVQEMANALAEASDLPVDDLPRSPGGRIDRAAAREQFDGFRTAVEDDPQSWRRWYHLAFAYDAAGDRKQARACLRKAAALYRQP